MQIETAELEYVSPIIIEDPESDDDPAEEYQENVVEKRSVRQPSPKKINKRFKPNNIQQEKEKLKLKILQVRLDKENLEKSILKVKLEKEELEKEILKVALEEKKIISKSYKISTNKLIFLFCLFFIVCLSLE